MPELDEDVLEQIQVELRNISRAQTVAANAASTRAKADILAKVGQQRLSQDDAEELLYQLDTLDVPPPPE